jgi:hypothetical protein
MFFFAPQQRLQLNGGEVNERMLPVRRLLPSTHRWCLVLLLFSISVLAAAQRKDDKDRDNDKEEAEKGTTRGAAHLIKVEGKIRCDKPDPAYSIEVPDRPGHALMLGKRKCTWTEPMTIMGAKSQEGVAVEFPEKMEGRLHSHGFEVDTFDNGERVTWQSMGSVAGDKGPATASGRWSLMRGTGKFKGIKGGGSYEGKLDADDVLVLELEGVYDPSEMAGDQK